VHQLCICINHGVQFSRSYSGNNAAKVLVVIILYNLFQEPIYYISLDWYDTSLHRYNYFYGSDTKDYAKLTTSS